MQHENERFAVHEGKKGLRLYLALTSVIAQGKPESVADILHQKWWSVELRNACVISRKSLIA